MNSILAGYRQNTHQPNNQNGTQNQNFMQKAMEFGQMVNGNPQTIVQNLLSSGKMSQSQFQQYAQIANQMLGR